MVHIRQTLIMSNYDALLTLIGDINNAFCHLEEEDVADVCDGDIELLDLSLIHI